jgi:hypothetical protein
LLVLVLAALEQTLQTLLVAVVERVDIELEQVLLSADHSQ